MAQPQAQQGRPASACLHQRSDPGLAKGSEGGFRAGEEGRGQDSGDDAIHCQDGTKQANSIRRAGPWRIPVRPGTCDSWCLITLRPVVAAGPAGRGSEPEASPDRDLQREGGSEGRSRRGRVLAAEQVGRGRAEKKQVSALGDVAADPHRRGKLQRSGRARRGDPLGPKALHEQRAADGDPQLDRYDVQIPDVCREQLQVVLIDRRMIRFRSCCGTNRSGASASGSAARTPRRRRRRGMGRPRPPASCGRALRFYRRDGAGRSTSFSHQPRVRGAIETSLVHAQGPAAGRV